MANAIYEFATAYALAEELNQELVLDIVECTVSAWGYLPDYYNIPRIKKVIYCTVDATKLDYTDVMGIFEAIRQSKIIYVEKDSFLFYVYFLGYDDAALKEFICLSLCTHRIISNSSTFGRLADELNWAEDRKAFWKDISRQNDEENISAIDFSRRNIRLSWYDIAYYNKRYAADQKEGIADCNEIITQILKENINNECI